MKNRLNGERKVLIAFLSLPLILIILFGLIPIICLIYYSFTEWNGISQTKEIVYFDNYIKILTSEKYLEVFKNCFYYLVSGLLQIVIGFILALILYSKTKFKGFFKGVFLFPVLISGVAISMIFRVFFAPNGTLDGVLTLIGLEENIRYWLGDPKVVNWTLSFISLWRYTGMSFILYFCAMQSIPIEQFKVLEIEGGGVIQKIFHVIIPNIKTSIKINFIMLFIGVVSVFDIPMIMTDGSNGTSTFLLKTMKVAFEDKEFGMASAMAVILSLILISIMIIRKIVVKGDKNEK